MDNKEEGFFVGINNPIDVRRNILECSREMIKTLQSIEKIGVIRVEKVKRIQQLKTVARELDLLVTKLRNNLPKTHLRAASQEAPNSRIKLSKSPDTVGELQELEGQLGALEAEISRLS